MDVEDGFTTFHVGGIENDLTIETACTEQGGIENVGTVGGSDDDDIGVGFKPVHFDEDLVEGLFTFVVRATHAGTTMATDGVDFVYEDDGGERGVWLVRTSHVHERRQHRQTFQRSLNRRWRRTERLLHQRWLWPSESSLYQENRP